MKQLTKGIVFILLSSFFFALMAAFVKAVPNVPLAEKIFFRNIIGVILMGAIILKKKKSFLGSNVKLLIMRSVFGLLGVGAYFYSIPKLPLSDAVLLNKMSPFLVIIFSVIFLKEEINKLQIYAIILAIIGAGFVIKPQFNFTIIPYLIGLSSAIFAAAAYTIIRELRKYADPEAIVFFFCLFSSVTSLPFMLSGGYSLPSGNTLLILLLIGCAATTAQILMTTGYRYAPASQVAIYGYMNIIFSTIIGIIVWNEFPDLLSIIGGVFIILAGIINYMSNNQESEDTN